MLKKLLQFKLKILAKIILVKYKPDIIGITGSVGKTSAKNAIYAVLSTRFNVRKNIKNYNNEIGLPLTIIGAKSAGRSAIGWMIIFLKAAKLIFFRNKYYPKILVLEMGIDRAGDMSYLLSIAPCKVGVVTIIGHSHLKFFGSVEKIEKEKGKLIESLPKNGFAVLNYDDEKVKKTGDRSRARILSYGFGENAAVRAREVIFHYSKKNADGAGREEFLSGINFKLSYQGSFVPVFLPEVISKASVYAALAGASLGIVYEMNLIDVAEGLKTMEQPKGRMRVLPGIKNTLLIDDTYNSSPESSLLALDVLSAIPIREDARRFAILGDMLELGIFCEEGHRMVGKHIFESKIDKLITVGERSRDIARGAEGAGMKRDNIFHFPDAVQAGRFAQERMREGDLLLIKGSQGVRMEKVVKEIMRDPLKAEELLVRQTDEWENR
ncbi:hypothetical protein A2331_05090 [Candidatus Falkowbacteria bacterium RIFOXYB2_FULL_34_18]|uniref:UDP-N-acetylmuramoyl-tripeptide--D-alanyl-D-alanine ligase n=1 Tax=Candidatus Falkowbacteria bacterium RIFOXYD2_FULL_34_120 TaxID=1798007 RepID=A0A1F5TNA8_9BACT|nr:MAG: hypothetical protein A2500_07155 [Candidatus Falkowbacteria bacterium RIFOXYC12_FULL_34_55]OGF28721.1 MAG: hypothetical protein A2331_05090 [Candidatus Falkowbacteria bacterium RIFOXYB2_FULL_34_18]OGF38086.1 MAG: hypothetical protein A2466_04270 [Candidatus Falkowbacteria bacterium RIFOXYC2_FULL_34_220]OGF38340.1 MAG: hypothetical protein A2515_06300 [Candidatus Falkowbacteria bacterium RIFOXYD12_FULL_34_57]OGF40327.1 MAG: hypothetical protein A2531_00560 [Candidatus Falkowbacteria bact